MGQQPLNELSVFSDLPQPVNGDRPPPMARRISWNGTTEEALALLHALRVHCECRVDEGRLLDPCASHSMLAHDQRAIDGLLFMRRMAAGLMAQEFEVAAPALRSSVPA
jgi:hypothetical protein